MTRYQKLRAKRTKKTINHIKGRPQLKGTIIKVYTMTPKKPNSALRKVANVRVILNPRFPTKSSIVVAYIPGENHTLTVHNVVLIKPRATKDLPGVKWRVIKGALDFKHH